MNFSLLALLDSLIGSDVKVWRGKEEDLLGRLKSVFLSEQHVVQLRIGVSGNLVFGYSMFTDQIDSIEFSKDAMLFRFNSGDVIRFDRHDPEK